MKKTLLHHIALAVMAVYVMGCLTGCSAAVQAVRQLRGTTAKNTNPVDEQQEQQGAPGNRDGGKFPQGSVQDIRQTSYELLSSRLRESGKAAGVAFIGYVSNPMEPEEYWNLLQRRGYLESYDFLEDIPQENLVQTAGGHQLYCIVPADPDSSVTVSEWSVEYGKMGQVIFGNETGQVGDLLYRSDSGEPILLLCGDELAEANLQVRLTQKDGEGVTWHPYINPLLDRMSLEKRNQDSLLDFSLYNLEIAENYDSKIAAPEVLHGDWVAWDAHTLAGEPMVCCLSFYQDEEGNERAEYFYGPPMGDVDARFEGDFVPSAEPTGWITEDMSEFRMQLVGGTMMESGLVPESFAGVYEIRYYPGLDVIDVSHMFQMPLLDGMDGATFTFVRAVG